jgi:conjugal transfer pilus assembly protein TraE
MPDETAMKVALAGVLMTWVGDKKASEKQTTYVVGFRYRNGRLHVSEFRETSDRDPFGADAAAR